MNIDKIITYNYNQFGNEFGDTLVDLKNENERLNNELEKQNIDYGLEIERLKEDNKELQKCHKDMLDINLENEQELNKLHSIIKEVREYIENKQELNKRFGTITLSKESQKELLEILDKENK